MAWDPDQYARYADERSRPFADLVRRVGAESPRRVVDLGCGPGTLTARLAQRWPSAIVEGIDSSPEMLATAAAFATGTAVGAVSFELADVTEWTMPPDTDVLVSNATLQWVPGHRELLMRWAAQLPAGGWLAFPVPGNFDSPTHSLMRTLAGSQRWAAALDGVLGHHDSVSAPAEYAALLLGAGLQIDVWETTYLHILPGRDPVLEWLRGTGLRPVLAALSPEEGRAFEAEFGALLRSAYPPTPQGTVLPYRRIFAVGHRKRP